MIAESPDYADGSVSLHYAVLLLDNGEQVPIRKETRRECLRIVSEIASFLGRVAAGEVRVSHVRPKHPWTYTGPESGDEPFGVICLDYVIGAAYVARRSDHPWGGGEED